MDLWPHQEEALKAVVAEIGGGGRAQTTMACGTGKTFVGAEVSRQVAPNGRVLIVVPTLDLLEQTAREYERHLENEVGAIGAVCSAGRSATQGRARLRSQFSRHGLGRTTDPAEVAAWTRREGRITVLATYNSLHVLRSASKDHDARPWDLVIADEAHHCAGQRAGRWRMVHDQDSIPAERRQFMTATPRLLPAENADHVSMDDIDTFGPEVYHLPFAKSIDLGLLAEYRVLVPVITPAEMRMLYRSAAVSAAGPAVPPEMLVAQAALLKAHAEYNFERVLTFHTRVAAAHRFSETLLNTADLMPDRPQRLYTAAVDGTMPVTERSEILRHLKEPAGRLVVVSNVKVLGEGVDVPALDAVLFADPKDSTTDIVQAVGRALRTGGNPDKTATIIVPLLLGEGETPEAALESSQWDTLYRIVRALRAHDERLAAWLDRARINGARGGGEPAPPWLHVIGTPVGPDLVEALRLRIVEKATSAWVVGYAHATAYWQTHGHLDVVWNHVTDSGFELGKWIVNRRVQRRRGELAANREAALDRLGISWDPLDPPWIEFAHRLVEFYREFGHLTVGRFYETDDGYGLGWRMQYAKRARNRPLPQRAKRILAEGGIDWDAVVASPGRDYKRIDWSQVAKALAAFEREHGHTTVPIKYVTVDDDGNELKLGRVIQDTRKRKDKLPPDAVKMLDEAGMNWQGRHQLAAQRLLDACRNFRAENGDLNQVPWRHSTPDGYRLAQRLHDLKKQARKGKLDPELRKALEALGVRFDDDRRRT